MTECSSNHPLSLGLGNIPSSVPGYFITPNRKVRKVFCFLQSGCFEQHHNKVIYDCSCPWPIWRTDIGMLSTDEPILRLHYINQTWMRLLSNTCELRVWVWEIFSTWKGGHALCSDRPSHRVQPLLLGLQFQWRVVQQLPIHLPQAANDRNISASPCRNLGSGNSCNA